MLCCAVQTHTIITGDIGGTNARLGLWKCAPGGKNVEVYSETYSTSTFPTFEECLQAFLDETEVRCRTQQQRGRQSDDLAAAQRMPCCVRMRHLHTQAGSGRASHRTQHSMSQWFHLAVALFWLASPLQVRGSQVEAAALAVAGAVENNRCPMTNITWVIDGKSLQQQFKFKTAVLNDFEAVGYGIPALDAKDMVVLNDVPMVPQAPKVVMGPGACSRAEAGCVLSAPRSWSV